MPLSLEYHGNLGLILKFNGSLNTDKYGMDSAQAVWSVPMDNHSSLPDLGTTHPVWSWMVMEKRRVDIEPGFAIGTGEYVGIRTGRTPSLFECSYAETEEPITTHPKFVSTLGGKPSDPKNGAIFVDVETGEITRDDTRGVFLEFKKLSDDSSDLGGTSSFLSPQATLRETWISLSNVGTAGLGLIASPPFGISAPNGGNWLFTGISFQQRGLCFVNTREWRSSGRRGWNSDIYS